jgi:anti-sigma regulatory factor (Ser/Thr protein kinase)
MQREQRVELPPQPSSAREARRFVARALRDAGPESRELGILLASELVTNALLYAQGRIVLEVAPRGTNYRISVHDPMPGNVGPRQVPVTATSGRGLQLVEQLSEAWGVQTPAESGKDVWFEIPRA